MFVSINPPAAGSPFFSVTDGGLGDLDPADGVIRFTHLIDSPGFDFAFGRRRISGEARYEPGTPYVGAMGLPGFTGFGVILTDLVVESIAPPTQGRGEIDIFVSADFPLGIAAADDGLVVTAIDGTVRTNDTGYDVEDLGSWAGVPVVSSGHVVRVFNPQPGEINTIPFDLPGIRSPLAKGTRPVETVTYQLLTFFTPPDAQAGPGKTGEFRLPDSGSALVFPVPEPATALLGGAALLLMGAAIKRRQ